MTQMEDQQMFLERYLVQNKIVDALYGPILQCQDMTTKDHENVAIKVITRAHPTADKTRLTPCDDPHQEKRIIQMLVTTHVHPHVVQYKAIYEAHDGAHLAFVMEHCSGGDLQQVLSQKPHQRLEERHALLWFHQIAQGMVFLHQTGLAHRDLSLENVLVTSEGVCKLCDFALCVPAAQKCVGLVGKRYYMAPEVVAGQVYDPVQADLWSLGVLLFMMLTGCSLWPLAKEDDVVLQFLAQQGLEKLLQLWQMDHLISTSTLQVLVDLLQLSPCKRQLRLDLL